MSFHKDIEIFKNTEDLLLFLKTQIIPPKQFFINRLFFEIVAYDDKGSIITYVSEDKEDTHVLEIRTSNRYKTLFSDATIKEIQL